MKFICVPAIVSAAFVFVGSSFGQVLTVYDNGVSSVGNGRVNDANFPVFLMYADNFSLASSAQVNRVDWLGAYKNGNLLPDAPDGFTIQFFAFSDGTPATTPFATYQVGAAARQVTSQTLISGNPVFSYSAQIPTTSFGAGTYLLSIMNSHAGTKSWLWADADAPNGDSFAMLAPGAPWRESSGGGVAEFAFSLSLIPEPSGVALMGFGGLFYLLARRHQYGNSRHLRSRRSAPSSS